MSTASSTEDLLNSFPMFGHPGISALEYAGSVEATHSKRNTSETLESLKRKSTTSTPDENTTPPTTASTETCDFDSPSQVHVIEDLGCQQRRRGTFLNHTPRYYEMRSSPTMDMHGPSRVSTENYSRPRAAYRSDSGASSRASGSRDDDNPLKQCRPIENRLTINRGCPTELDATEKHPTSSLEALKPTTTDGQLSLAVLHDDNDTNQFHSITLVGDHDNEWAVRSTTKQVRKPPQEKKRQRRQTPFRLAAPRLTDPSRHAPLEPWVAKHRQEAIKRTDDDLLLQSDAGAVKEMGTFGVIQRYFDSQTGGPVSSPNNLCGTCCPTPQNLSPPTSSTSYPQESFREPVAIFPIDGLNFPDEEPPAVPDRSPKRVTNPGFPFQYKPMLPIDSDFAFAADGKYSPYEDNDDVLHVPKKRTPERVEIGLPAPAGLSKVGRMAPPILGHEALAAGGHLGMNDLSYYLKHTGPASGSPQTTKQSKINGLKIFKVRQRKTLAARVGSVEGFPQKRREPTPVPTCAKEVTTSSGTRHLKIIIPAEKQSANHAPSVSISSQTKTRRRSRHISITFTEEMLNPLASPRVERILSTVGALPERSFSEPIIGTQARNPKTLRSSIPMPVDKHPLELSREESVRARKLRDLQRVKKKPSSINTQVYQRPDTSDSTLRTPTGTLGLVFNYSSPNTLHESEGRNACDLEEDSPVEKMARLQNRVVLLQRQNTELTEALAKIVGLELEEGDLNTEDVLRAFRHRKLLLQT